MCNFGISRNSPLRGLLISFVLPLFFAGCSQNSAFRNPAATLNPPPSWTAATLSEGNVADGWISEFGDEHLVSLVTQAMAANHSLAAAEASLRSAGELARINGASTWPTIEGSLTGSRGRSHTAVHTNRFQGVVSIAWELDYLGKVRDHRRAAEADLGETVADFETTRLALAASVARAWFDLLEADAQQKLAAKTLTSFESNLSIIEEQYGAGLSTALDLRLLRANVANARAALAVRSRTRDDAARLLEVLVGDYPANRLVVSTTLPDLTAPPPPGLPSSLLLRRPDMRSAEFALEAASLRASEARKELFPSIKLTSGTNVGRSSDELEGLLDGSNAIWNLAGGLTAPLFQGGKLRANSAQKRYLAEAALATYRQTALTAFQEVESALAAEEYLRVREDALLLAASESNDAEELAWEQYRRGLTGIVTALEAQRRAVSARESVISARNQRLSNRVALHLALGGGFE